MGCPGLVLWSLNAQKTNKCLEICRTPGGTWGCIFRLRDHCSWQSWASGWTSCLFSNRWYCQPSRASRPIEAMRKSWALCLWEPDWKIPIVQSLITRQRRAKDPSSWSPFSELWALWQTFYLCGTFLVSFKALLTQGNQTNFRFQMDLTLPEIFTKFQSLCLKFRRAVWTMMMLLGYRGKGSFLCSPVDFKTERNSSLTE